MHSYFKLVIVGLFCISTLAHTQGTRFRHDGDSVTAILDDNDSLELNNSLNNHQVRFEFHTSDQALALYCWPPWYGSFPGDPEASCHATIRAGLNGETRVRKEGKVTSVFFTGPDAELLFSSFAGNQFSKKFSSSDSKF